MTMLFKPAQASNAFLKMGLMGFPGSGKTYTSTLTAIGMIKLVRDMGLPYASKPAFFLDTEKGSDWVLPQFKKAGIDLHTAKTRAFTDLIAAVNEAEQNASLLLIDSATHFWREFCDTYVARKAAEFRRSTYQLQFPDWQYLKAEWNKFTDRFINSKLHVILAGRAGYEYDFREDEERPGKKNLEKTGVKMKAETEMAYEPDLFVLMERVMDMTEKRDEHIAHVLKDRSTRLDGAEIANPTFEAFLPHVKGLALGGEHMGVDTSRTSSASIPAGSPRDKAGMQRAIVIEEINDLLLRHEAGGTSIAEKKKRSDLMQTHFGTVSKTKIEEALPLFDLRAGYDSLHQALEGKPSRYTPASADPGEMPEFLKREKGNGHAPVALGEVDDSWARLGDSIM